jgi:outer membrane protein OmpA-like peptidoglycan-associated protein
MAKGVSFAFLFFLTHIIFGQCPKNFVKSETNLVKNGDFEQDSSFFITDYIRREINTPCYYNIVQDAFDFSSRYFTGTGDGFFMAVDGGTRSGMRVWEQAVYVKPHTTYLFSCSLSTLNVATGFPAIVQLLIDGKQIGRSCRCPSTLNKWKEMEVVWNSEEGNSAVITLVSKDLDWYGNDFGLDNIKLCRCIDPKQNQQFVPKDVFFETASADILSAYEYDLNALADFLLVNRHIKVEVLGYTDSIDNEEYNLELSQRRAKSIVAYLASRGISTDRLVAHAYGEQHPREENDTEEGRKRNRRVEIKLQ